LSPSPSLFLGLVLLAHSLPEAKDSEIRGGVFLGQIYPSGRIYLRQFPSPPKTPAARAAKASGPGENERFTTPVRNRPAPLGALTPWPREVLAINTDAHQSLGTKVTRAWFVKVLVDEPADEKNPLWFSTEYIPGLEGMDSRLRPCGMSKYTQDTGFTYWSVDFFENTQEHCESTQGVAVYQSDFVSEHSFRVIAFHKDWKLAGYTVDSRRTPRPLQPGEPRPAVKPGSVPAPLPDEGGEAVDMKMEMEMGGEGSEDCPYGRRFRDSARRLVTAQLTRPALDLELSVYRDPLCFMHWNDIYLLDVRKGGKWVQTLELVNYKGMQ
jgi:hypothetical protein